MIVMMDVWFIRHGECTANIGDATSSAHEAHLTARGWQEAYAIADYLSHLPEHKLTRIISSPYIRARQTALATQDMLGVKNVETLPVQEFNYLALPNRVSTTSAQRSPLVKDYCERCKPFYRHRDKAESFADFIDRVQNVLNKLQGQKYKEDMLIVVFSHHQFMLAIRWLLEREGEIHPGNLRSSEMREFYAFAKNGHIPNGAIVKTALSQNEYHLWPEIEISHLHNQVEVSPLSDKALQTCP